MYYRSPGQKGDELDPFPLHLSFGNKSRTRYSKDSEGVGDREGHEQESLKVDEEVVVVVRDLLSQVGGLVLDEPP